MTKNNLQSTRTLFDRDEFITPIDKLMDKIFNQSFPNLSKEVGMDVFQSSAYPKCDIIEFADRIEIIAEVSGLRKDQISIDVDTNAITIKGEKSVAAEKEGGVYLRRELKRSSFKRTITTDPKIFDLDKITAKFEGGILELSIPKLKITDSIKKTIEIV
jgi:HSP20 family protein